MAARTEELQKWQNAIAASGARAEEWQRAMKAHAEECQKATEEWKKSDTVQKLTVVAGAVQAAKRKQWKVEDDILERVPTVPDAVQAAKRKQRKAEDDILEGVRAAGEMYSNGAKVGAAQTLTAALRSDKTEPIFHFLDKSLKKDSPATSEDFLGCKVLWHRTDPGAGESIERSKTMRPGFEGVLGAGIYFAEDEEATKVKTRHGDEAYAVVEALVDLGHCRVVSLGEREWRMICDGGFDKQHLLDLGFQSVGSCFNGGWEYCVFDSQHVQVLNVVQHTC